ncbi:MAG: hypothetical protein HY22_02220 [[Candidatus Thermochlorobacteriaceae] bacterium GBChlB]|nr:MAG: hypothetical protein HY22_02220 [[Candidatus Thermochlorobacteriaceae] bacterium GBChlB]
MTKSQLSLSFEKHSILLVLVNQGDGSWYNVQQSVELKFDDDLYANLLDKGHTALMTHVSQKLSETLARVSTSRLSVCLNLSGAKCVTVQLDRALDAEAFNQECKREAELFLRDPSEYIWQPIQLSDGQPSEFDNYLLVFLPKRYLTRLRMMLLASRKDINLVDVSHISLQHLQMNPQMKHALLEIERDYVSLSTVMSTQIEAMKYWPLEVETDVAYFALSEIKKIAKGCPVSLVGSSVTDEIIGFVSSALKTPVQRATLPPNFVLSGTDKPEKYLKAIGCAVKAMSYF